MRTLFITVNLAGDRIRLFLKKQTITPQGGSDSDEGFEVVPRAIDDLSQDFVLVNKQENPYLVSTVNIPSNTIVQAKAYIEIQCLGDLPKELGGVQFIIEVALSVGTLADSKKFISGLNDSRYGECYIWFGLEKQVAKKPLGSYYAELELSSSYFVEIVSLDEFKKFINQKYTDDYRKEYNQSYKDYNSGSYYYYLPAYFTSPTHPGAKEGLDDAKNQRPNKYFP